MHYCTSVWFSLSHVDCSTELYRLPGRAFCTMFFSYFRCFRVPLIAIALSASYIIDIAYPVRYSDTHLIDDFQLLAELHFVSILAYALTICFRMDMIMLTLWIVLDTWAICVNTQKGSVSGGFSFWIYCAIAVVYLAMPWIGREQLSLTI
jgi:hypothetical protein